MAKAKTQRVTTLYRLLTRDNVVLEEGIGADLGQEEADDLLAKGLVLFGADLTPPPPPEPDPAPAEQP